MNEYKCITAALMDGVLLYQVLAKDRMSYDVIFYLRHILPFFNVPITRCVSECNKRDLVELLCHFINYGTSFDLAYSLPLLLPPLQPQ